MNDILTKRVLPSLWLKSAPVSASNGNNTTPAHTVLCTRGATYQLRQVQTSNTVLLVQPVSQQADGNNENSSVDPAITAFATCTSTLELQDLKTLLTTELKPTSDWLAESLLVYNDSGAPYPPSQTRSKISVFQDIPFSDDECEEAWVNQVAFEWRGGCWLLAPDLLLDAWTRLMGYATTQNIDLASDFPASIVNEAIEDMNVPEAFSRAFLARHCKHLSYSVPDNTSINLDKTATIAWVGEVLVSAPTNSEKEDGVWQVVEKWQNLVPEKWRNSITTKDVLALRHKIRGVSTSLGHEEVLEEQINGAKRPAATSIKRNWHEKFKRSRA